MPVLSPLLLPSRGLLWQTASRVFGPRGFSSKASGGGKPAESWTLVQEDGGWTETYDCKGSAEEGFVFSKTQTRTQRAESAEPAEEGWKELMRRTRCLMRQTFLPAGYPGTTGHGYLGYVAWQGLTNFTVAANTVLASTFLLYSVGLGQGAIPTAGALNWVLKDGLGQLGTLIFGKTIAHNFDVHSKSWYFLSMGMLKLALGLEILTIMMPQYFLLVGSLANSLKGLSWMASGSTRSVFNLSFAKDNNIADITAKGTSQYICASMFGTVAGASLCQYVVGQDTATALACYSALTAATLYGSYATVKTIPLPTLNGTRLQLLCESFLQSVNKAAADRRAARKARMAALLSSSDSGSSTRGRGAASDEAEYPSTHSRHSTQSRDIVTPAVLVASSVASEGSGDAGSTGSSSGFSFEEGPPPAADSSGSDVGVGSESLKSASSNISSGAAGLSGKSASETVMQLGLRSAKSASSSVSSGNRSTSSSTSSSAPAGKPREDWDLGLDHGFDPGAVGITKGTALDATPPLAGGGRLGDTKVDEASRGSWAFGWARMRWAGGGSSGSSRSGGNEADAALGAASEVERVYDEALEPPVPSPVELAIEDPPLPFLMGDQRILNPAIIVGANLEQVLDGTSPELLAVLLTTYRLSKAIVVPRGSAIHVVLHQQAGARDICQAYIQACLLRRRMRESAELAVAACAHAACVLEPVDEDECLAEEAWPSPGAGASSQQQKQEQQVQHGASWAERLGFGGKLGNESQGSQLQQQQAGKESEGTDGDQHTSIIDLRGNSSIVKARASARSSRRCAGGALADLRIALQDSLQTAERLTSPFMRSLEAAGWRIEKIVVEAERRRARW